MSIVLDTPETINAWVLLSRISQCHLHMKGLKVNGLMKWLKANVPDVTTERTVKAAYPRLLDFCDQYGVSAPGGEMCNYQVLLTAPKGSPLHGLYLDKGVFSSTNDIGAIHGEAYAAGRVVIIRTMEDIRDPDTSIRMSMS